MFAIFILPFTDIFCTRESITMSNPFLLEKEAYKRDTNVVAQYAQQLVEFLVTSTGQPKDKVVAFVKDGIQKNKFNWKDPNMVYLERQANQDREKRDTTLMQYVSSAIKNDFIIAPTLTCYINPKEKEALSVKSVRDNVAKRSKAKKGMFAATDSLTKTILDITQTNAKLSNNAYSGAMCSKGTPLFNPTGHSTLTSMCRSASGYGNANNEKIVAGNRHYWSPDTVLNNIVSITTNTDYATFSVMLDTYGLICPTVEDTMECITYSSDLYWSNAAALNNIRNYVCKLTDIQRAAFVYTGDLYHIKKHNEEFTREFIRKLSAKIIPDKPLDPELTLKTIKAIPEEYLVLAHHICVTEMKGKGKDYAKLKGTPELDILCSTGLNIQKTLEEYFAFIRAIFVSDNVPASMAYFPTSVRRVAIVSDTDSTIFTAQEWVRWYFKEVTFDETAVAVGATIIFLACQTITHVLAKMSANYGIGKENLNIISMKNEYYFDVFVPTNVAKHYFAIMSVQEGNVFDKDKTEIKGVHLKNSNAPKAITKKASDMMLEIMATVRAGKKVSMLKYLAEVATIEKEIFLSIANGESKYLRMGKIKNPQSYKNPEQSPYNHHKFWLEVFAPKYGFTTEPPYSTLKITTNMSNGNSAKEWLESIKDTELKERIIKWMTANNKTVITGFQVPIEVTRTHGLPVEIRQATNSRRIVGDISNVFYIILESLGFYIDNDKSKLLISDMY